MENENRRDFGLPRTVAILVFVFLIAYPFAQVLHRVEFGAAMPVELGPTVWMSLRQAAWSLAASLFAGIPLGIYYAGVWSRGLRALATASFSLPALLVIGMMSLVLRGTEFRFGLPTVIGAHAFLNAPWIALATAEGIRSVPRSWVEAARTLGATRMRSFFRIELPWIARRIVFASAQVFALCLMSFAIVMVLGGGPPVVTLETEIYAAVRGSGLELSKASWFAITQLGLAALPLLLVAGFRLPPDYRDSLAGCNHPRGTGPSLRKTIAHGIAAAWLLFPGICFLRATPYKGFTDLFPNAELQSALLVSLQLAFSTVAASLAVGAIFAWGSRHSRFTRMIAAIPAGLSPLMIALGFFLAYSSYIDPFEGSVAGMVWVQTALFLPFSLRFFLPLLDEEHGGPRRALLSAARTLGATPFRAWWKLEWPRWRAAGIRLSALIFVWSFSELAATSFFGSERLTTVGVLLMRWMGQYRFDDVNAVLFGIYLFSSAALLAFNLRDTGGEA